MSERVVIIGGDAGGMAAAGAIRKLPGVELVAFERGDVTSYSACGIPFFIGGEIDGGIDRLIARSPEQHRRNGVDVRTGHEVMAIDLDRREVEVRHDGTTSRHGFDHLLIGTGGRPVRPPLPGIERTHSVHRLDDAERLATLAAESAGKQVVIVGSGYIGVEVAEAFLRRGIRPVVLEQADQPLGILDSDMGARVAAAMVGHGVDLRLGHQVTAFDDGVVRTMHGGVQVDVPADVVVVGLGIAPNSDLARAAGLELGVKGSIVVDERMATSVPGVWAAGDCVQSRHLVSGEAVHMALGTYANKQARVAGINIAGGEAVFPGVLGTAITRIVDTEIAVTGITERDAARLGWHVEVHTIETMTRAHYDPGVADIAVKLVALAGSGRLVGAQIVGGPGAGKRIDTCVVAITAGMLVDDIVDLDLAYAPPFSPVWDPVATAARSFPR
jgi:NADPH-dependent 2,4-dienoyl-CoA reductase/sulfur reductase-like enzyme